MSKWLPVNPCRITEPYSECEAQLKGLEVLNLKQIERAIDGYGAKINKLWVQNKQPVTECSVVSIDCKYSLVS